MATTAASSLQMATARPCISSSHRVFRSSAAMLHGNSKVVSSSKLSSACHISSVQSFQRSFTSSSLKMDKFVTKAMAGSSENKPSGLPIDLKGLIFFPTLVPTLILALDSYSSSYLFHFNRKSLVIYIGCYTNLNLVVSCLLIFFSVKVESSYLSIEAFSSLLL